MPCTEVRHRVLQMENQTAVLGDGRRYPTEEIQCSTFAIHLGHN